MAELPGAIERDVFALLAIQGQSVFLGAVGVKMRSWRKGVFMENIEVVPVGSGFGKRHDGMKLKAERFWKVSRDSLGIVLSTTLNFVGESRYDLCENPVKRGKRIVDAQRSQRAREHP